MSDAVHRASTEGRDRVDVPRVPQSMAPIWFLGHMLAMLGLHFLVPIAQWNLGATRWLGLPPALCGFLLVMGGAGRFRRRATTLRPYEEPSALVTDGLHRYSRNPMYLGLLLAAFGAWIMLGSLSPGLAVLSLYALLRRRFIAWEEYAMEARFGDAYRAYRQRVRRWL